MTFFKKITFAFVFLSLCLVSKLVLGKPYEISSPSGGVLAAEYQAIILLNSNTINATGRRVVSTEHQVVKLLSPEAVRQYSDALLFYYVTPDQKWTIDQVKITTPDGSTKNIPVDEAKVVSPLAKFPPYNHLKEIFLPLSGLQPGDVLNYTVTKTEKFWIAGNFWDMFFLQDQNPVKDLKVSVIEKSGKKVYVKEMNGTLPLPTRKIRRDGSIRMTWRWKNVHPYHFSSSELPNILVSDIVPKFLISSVSHWSQIKHAVNRRFFTPVVSGTGVLRKFLKGLLKTNDTSSKKERLIYDFVDLDIKSLPSRFGGDFGIIPHTLNYQTILRQGLGDDRDKAALLFALYQKEGLHPQLALISTLNNGKYSAHFPIPSVFNRVLVGVPQNGETLWLDPFVQNAPFGYLPPEDQHRTAFLLNSDSFIQTPVLPPHDNFREVVVSGTLTRTGGLNESLRIKVDGANSIGMRTLLQNVPLEQRQKVVSALAAQIAGGQPKVQQVMISSVTNLNKPLIVGLKFKAPHYATVAGNLSLISLPFNSSNGLKMILKEKGTRTYPFVIGSKMQEIKRMTLAFPLSYRVRYIPKSVKIQNATGFYQAYFKVVKNKLMFDSNFIINKRIIQPDQFSLFKDLVSKKLKTESTKIVFEKTGVGKQS